MSIPAKSSKPKVGLIAGPTASGKSALAVTLAQRLAELGRKSVILNADSAQVYDDLRIISARPSEAEMGGIEHRLFGTWDGAVACSAADWATTAKREIGLIHAEGAIPILVGGTGLYLRTLFDGIAPVPVIAPEIRTEIRAMSQVSARSALEREDPAAAERLAPADGARTARALEVVRSTGRTLASWQELKVGGIADSVAIASLVLLPERDWLFERCDRRFAAMLDDSGPEEVGSLMARRLNPDLPVMRAIGVREVGALLQGELSREEALIAGQTATRHYAKRQYTWFRRQCPSEWLKVESKNCYKDAMEELLLRFLY